MILMPWLRAPLNLAHGAMKVCVLLCYIYLSVAQDQDCIFEYFRNFLPHFVKICMILIHPQFFQEAGCVHIVWSGRPLSVRR
jgi:hypothetical protein